METLSPPPVQQSVQPSVRAPATPDSSTGYEPPRADVRWLRRMADELSAHGATPRTLAVAGLAAALIATALVPAGVLVASGVGTAALVFAAAFIQLRFVCELVGARMEGPTSTGFLLYWGIPDLVADAALVAVCGYTMPGTALGPFLGWSAAMLGVFLAHAHATTPDPRTEAPWTQLASPRWRMTALTGVCVLAALLPYGWRSLVFLFGLVAIASVCGVALWFRIGGPGTRPLAR
jgi:hypothetical protein